MPGMRIAEVPIPTYYGDEICYVDGMGYAADVTKDVVAYRLQKAGFGDGSRIALNEEYQLKPSEDSSHGRISHPAQIPPAEQDPRPRVFERPAGRTAAGDGPPRHRGRRQRAPRRRRADRRLLPGRPQ